MRPAARLKRTTLGTALAVSLSLMPALAACTAPQPDPAAEAVRPAIALHGRVTDAANILSPEAEAALVDRLRALEKRTGHQMVVATTPSLDGQPIETYSLALARAWGIGRKGANDGVLLLLAPQARSARIEVGTGLETALPNALCQTIMDEDMVPRFARSDYAAGLEAGIESLSSHLD